ncbi:hypothetical protein MFIFM68171_08181 [Madurella fahalii]|uniref:Uncharacterized protein n=1 Tax=Madurella fahalii TaxID=1157608 RepID=A0ABQ0GJN0_9PEZI
MELQSMPNNLLNPPNNDSRNQISLAFFGDGETGYKPDLYGPYFNYYERELKRLRIGVSKSSWAINSLAVQTHADVLTFCNILASERNDLKSAVIAKIKGLIPGVDDLAIDRSVDLTIRLWLMLNTQDDQLSLLSPQRLSIKWDNDLQLMEFVNRQFPTSTTKLGVRESRLSPSFTVASMVKLCNLHLEWTDSLETHLRLDRRSKTLWIFPFKDFLVAHLSTSKTVDSQRGIRRRQSLLGKHGQIFHSVRPFHGPRRFDLNEFDFWRDHLLELYEEIYLAPADSWRQLWIDRRNPHQYYTFWVALIVLLLSTGSFIASIVQAWASVKALNIQMASA